MLTTIIGRGHGGTRAMSHTLSQSDVYMGAPLNGSGDLVPPEDMYDACRVLAKYVQYKSGMEWDFSKLFTMDIDPEFTRLIESYLSSVLNSDTENKGWKIPETTLCFPWIVRMFPDAYYVRWNRNPMDSILGAHATDDLNDFGIEYDKRGDVRWNRAVSWKYQREIMKATPSPKKIIDVRFEDFILKQDETLKVLEQFYGLPLAKVAISTEPVGRWKNDIGQHYFDFLEQDMKELGYEIPEQVG